MNTLTRPRHSGRWSFLLILLGVGALIVSLLAATSAARASADDFVERCGIHFCINGETAYFAGANSYDLFTYGAGSGDTETQYMYKDKIDQQFADMAADGVNLVRTWMFSHENWHGFTPARGVQNEQEWALFDYILYSAEQHGVRVIPTFENYWSAYGGIGTILSWNGLANSHPSTGAFFDQQKCPGCLDDYLDHVDYALNRVNHYTGVAYKDDPTIFAWELMNEPRHQDQTPGDNAVGAVFNAWVDTVGAHIRSIDDRHMITTGVEGQGSEYGYGSDNGVPFVATCQNEYVDFCSAHLYPTEWWADLSIAETTTLLEQWIHDSHEVVGKPFFLGEFNAHGSERGEYWEAIYQTLEETDAAASAFWWYQDRAKDGTFGVLKGDPELAIFREHAAALAAKSGAVVTPNPGPTGTATPTPTPTPTATPTPSPTATPTPTPTPVPGGCRVIYRLDDWGSSFNANVTITNLGSTAIADWTLEFAFPGAQTISSAWNAETRQSGAAVTATGASWNATIPASGSASFGMNGTSLGGNGTPSAFTLNGVACTVG
ncbi:cellulose binding domain-containing protein [Microbacterium sp. M3]|uniref:Cellulose binding domain-containing protein n=1 Tax=Microbacterium arthrosphaerae TaxID=792652 RepID=A0ABU4GXW5_9MICO|nr:MULTISPECIES: cellulose binding domain-containing protein [Microbacterium]MDW4571923.1 cellulose binding domain-containing protein [Microbacterium arthrosphaerae]MDW7605778.1 cellulose binding domain-containing protein [Microbacterium sp. M3]